jgi:hypothetical protein
MQGADEGFQELLRDDATRRDFIRGVVENISQTRRSRTTGASVCAGTLAFQWDSRGLDRSAGPFLFACLAEKTSDMLLAF